MLSSMTSTKRTRSQLTLPEFHPHLARSPLKDARMALRNNPPTPPQPPSAGSDDEILLSPREMHAKRPSSPDKDQLLSEPQSKRPKHEDAPVQGRTSPGKCSSPRSPLYSVHGMLPHASPHSPPFRRTQSVPPQSPSPSTSRLPRPSTIPPPAPSPESFKPATKTKSRRTAPAPIPLGGRMTRSASLRLRENKKRGDEVAKTVSRPPPSNSHVIPTSGSKPALKNPSATSSTQHKRSRTVPRVELSTPVHTPSLQRFHSVTAGSKPVAAQSQPGSKSLHSSSLSSLSVALDKLNMPPPSRPSTSMGLNHKPLHSDAQFRDDAALAQMSNGASAPVSSGDNSMGRTSARPNSSSSIRAPPLKNATPVLDTGPRPTMRQTTLPFSPAGASVMKRVPLRPVPATPKVPVASGSSTAGSSSVPGRRTFGLGTLTGGLVGRGRVVHKASQKPSLSVVEGSPVKSGVNEGAEDGGIPADVPLPSLDIQAEMSSHVQDEREKGNEAEKLAEPWKRDASRRASLASQLLSESMSGQPHTPTTLATPPINGAATAPGKGKAPANKYAALAGTRSAPARSASLRSASAASPSTPDGSKAAGPSASMAVLKECTIFVDVRTDDGDNAGALFVDMLKGMGARILSRVGQTCTHIVFKNGLMSTLTRYRLLNEPRPLVVGIAWVVECAEQRARVDETRFRINLDGTNVAGANKRRRSMLPKQLQALESGLGTMGPPDVPRSFKPDTKANVADRQDSHPTMMSVDSPHDIVDGHADGSVNSPQDDSLAPLEKARRRRSMMFGS
ncbi:hypothetical protein B0H21DRAFT_883686 [Amylocystis lapponica]|nr:hypothetical protein B0H21DRAFT_883686 [Amylocystis lapponica]